jgi:hypothetical protein
MWNYLTYDGIGSGNVTLARTYFNAATFGMAYPVHVSDVSCAFYRDVDVDPAWASNQFRYAVGTGRDDATSYLHTSANLTALEDGSFIDYALPATLDITEDWFVEVQFVNTTSCNPSPMTNVHEEGLGIGWNSVWKWDGGTTNDPGFYAFTYTSPYEYEDFMIYCYGWNDEPTITKSTGRTNPAPFTGEVIKSKKVFGPAAAFNDLVKPKEDRKAPFLEGKDSKGLSTYQIWRNDARLTTTTNKAYTDTNPLSSNTYYITAIYTSPAGESAGSNEITLGPPPVAQYPATIAKSVPEADTATDSFNIGNTGAGDLNYTITFAYVGALSPAGTVHSNDFSSFPGTGYTNTGAFVDAGGAAVANNVSKNTVVYTLTSPTFSTVGLTGINFSFTQDYTHLTGAYAKVEYYSGSSWTELVNQTASTTTAQNFALPVGASRLRFTTSQPKKAGASSASWTIDNILVTSSEVPYTWLTINSSTTGTVTGSSSNAISYTCDTAGLTLDSAYVANITVVSNDDSSPAVIPFTLTVGGSVPVTPAVPSNFVTSIVTGNVLINWDDAADATSYDVYSSATPYGAFAFVTNVGVSQYTYTPTASKMFFQVISKIAKHANATFRSKQ